MKKFSMLFLAAAVALVGAIVAPTKAEAVPAFARQVGVPCYSCHFQHIPKLNSFGREFKLGGFTQSAQDLITDEGISLPPVLNIGVLMKVRFIMQGPSDKAAGGKAPTSDGTKYGEWNLPDEIGIFPAGRVGENMGALVEIDGHGDIAGNKFVFSKDFGGIRGGVTAFATRDAGLGYGMELFNTGLQRNQSGVENKDWLPNAIDGAWNSGAQGLSFFAGSSLFFANFGLVAPVCNDYAPGNGVTTNSTGATVANPSCTGGNFDAGFNFPMYLRAAITPKIGDMDLMVGVQYVTGTGKARQLESASNANGEVKADSMAIDAQLQADLGGMSLEVIGGFASVKHDALSMYNSGANDKTQMWLGGTLGLTKHAGVKLGYGATDKGGTSNTYNTLFLGGWYALAQNVDLSLDYAMKSGDARNYDNKMTLMLEFAY